MLRIALRALTCAALPLGLGACATTTTQLAPIAPERVAEEETLQRELAVRTQWRQMARLDSIARPLLVAALPLCEGAAAPEFGFRFGDTHDVPKEWREPAARALGIDEEPRVVAVTPGSPAQAAGLRPGDILRQVGGHVVTPGPKAVTRLGEHLATYTVDGPPVAIRVERDGVEQTLQLEREPICGFSTFVAIDGALNAYADGHSIVVTTAMMRFAEDEELAVILAHELAHNAMRHMDAMRKNQMAGGFLGLLADVAMASMGVNTGGYYTMEGMEAGAFAFSQDFEREADYVGMYALELAGLRLDVAPTFWRHMAVANPASIGLASTHPTTAERFVRMEAAMEEIAEKRRQKLPMMPERKKPREGR